MPEPFPASAKTLSKLCLGCAAASILAAAPVWSHDLGTEGTTWPIAEPSLLVTVVERLAAIDWNKKSAELIQAAENGVHNYAFNGLTPARETTTRYIDPSVTLQAPISAPVRNPDGTTTWKVVYPAGTRVNPLDRINPPTRLLVFDPRVSSQVAFAQAAIRRWPELIEPVANGGDLKGLADKIGRPVFYANAQFVARFGLRHTPSLIGVGAGPQADRLAVTEFGPHEADAAHAESAVRAAWYGLSTPPDPQMRTR